MDLIADDMAALLEHLGVSNAVICGASMGGYAAFAFWRRYSEKVRALVLASTRAGADSPEGKRARADLARRLRARGVASVIDTLLPKMFSDLTPKKQPQLIEQVRAMFEAANPEAMARALEGMAMREGSEDSMRGINISAMILHGIDDLIVPRGEALIMARAIRGAKFEQIERGGHLVNMEQPELFNGHLREFLEHLPLFFGLSDLRLA
jgi:pimeloyl-ACP methyl ester carboxylesterase